MNYVKEFGGRVKAIMAAAKAPANGGEHDYSVNNNNTVGGRRRESLDTQTTRGHAGAGQPSEYLSDYITPAAGLQTFRLLVGSKFPPHNDPMNRVSKMRRYGHKRENTSLTDLANSYPR
jgi:hypothetical protein